LDQHLDGVYFVTFIPVSFGVERVYTILLLFLRFETNLLASLDEKKIP